MKVAFFDIDGTLVEPYTIGLFLNFLAENGKFHRQNIDNFSKVTKEYASGNKTYEQLAASWGKELGEGLKGYVEQEVQAIAGKFWEIVKLRVAYWAKDIIAQFNNNGYTTIAISGSPIELLTLYKEKLGLQQVFASVAEVTNGVYTGKTSVNLVLGKEKEMIVNSIIQQEHVDLEKSFGFGDNLHDLAFLDKVGHPVAIISESNLKQYAEEKGWLIYNFGDDVSKLMEDII